MGLAALILAVCLGALGCSSKAVQEKSVAKDGSVQIYLVRHARAYRNEPHAGMTAEQLDSLTPHGIAQANEAADSLVKKHIVAVIASPTHRTMQTGKIIADKLHLPAPIADPAFAPMAESEPLASAMNRAMVGITALAPQHADQAIMIVTHGDICPLLIGAARGTPLGDRLTRDTVEPGTVTHLVWAKDKLHVAQ